MAGDKLKEFTTSIADAIRAKKKTTALIHPQDFNNEISQINTGDYFITKEYNEDGSYNLEIQTNHKQKKRCRVYDFDGTLLKEEYVAIGDVFILPDAPIHDRLLFKEWSGIGNVINNQVIVEDEVLLGAIYTTKSGKSEIDIELNEETGLTIEWWVINTATDWGDGTEPTTNKISHTYSEYGKYTITFSGGQIFDYIFGSNKNYFAKEMYFAEDIDCSYGLLLSNCAALTKVSIPISSISATTSLTNCLALECVVLPNIKFYDISLSNCTNLKIVICAGKMRNINSSGCGQLSEALFLKNRVNTILQDDFEGCNTLEKIEFNPIVTEIGKESFLRCIGLKTVIFPAKLQTIKNSAFMHCSALEVLDFTHCIQVPTINADNTFYNINEQAKFIVPDALYDEWMATECWGDRVDRIYKISEYLDLDVSKKINTVTYCGEEIEIVKEKPNLITKETAENGIYNATNDNADGYSSFVVNVPSLKGNPIEVATDEEMTNALSEDNIDKVYKFTGTSSTYETDAIYIVSEVE